MHRAHYVSTQEAREALAHALRGRRYGMTVAVIGIVIALAVVFFGKDLSATFESINGYLLGLPDRAPRAGASRWGAAGARFPLEGPFTVPSFHVIK